jgi:hypothetical protein
MMEKQDIKIELKKKQVAMKKRRKNYFMIMMDDTLNMYADMNRISGTCRGLCYLTVTRGHDRYSDSPRVLISCRKQIWRRTAGGREEDRR